MDDLPKDYMRLIIPSTLSGEKARKSEQSEDDTSSSATSDRWDDSGSNQGSSIDSEQVPPSSYYDSEEDTWAELEADPAIQFLKSNPEGQSSTEGSGPSTAPSGRKRGLVAHPPDVIIINSSDDDDKPKAFSTPAPKRRKSGASSSKTHNAYDLGYDSETIPVSASVVQNKAVRVRTTSGSKTNRNSAAPTVSSKKSATKQTVLDGFIKRRGD
jgi:hypothetical protein